MLERAGPSTRTPIPIDPHDLSQVMDVAATPVSPASPEATRIQLSSGAVWLGENPCGGRGHQRLQYYPPSPVGDGRWESVTNWEAGMGERA